MLDNEQFLVEHRVPIEQLRELQTPAYAVLPGSYCRILAAQERTKSYSQYAAFLLVTNKPPSPHFPTKEHLTLLRLFREQYGHFDTDVDADMDKAQKVWGMFCTDAELHETSLKTTLECEVDGTSPNETTEDIFLQWWSGLSEEDRQLQAPAIPPEGLVVVVMRAGEAIPVDPEGIVYVGSVFDLHVLYKPLQKNISFISLAKTERRMKELELVTKVLDDRMKELETGELTLHEPSEEGSGS